MCIAAYTKCNTNLRIKEQELDGCDVCLLWSSVCLDGTDRVAEK